MTDNTVLGNLPASVRSQTNRLATACLIGVSCFVLATVLLHIVQPELSPIDDAISYYMNGAWGRALSFGLVALGLGSLGLVVALAQTMAAQSGRTGRWALSIWGVGAILGGIFPPDPRGHWNEPPSISGMIHADAAMVAFLAFPLGAILVARSIKKYSARPSMPLLVLAWASAVSLLGFFACLAPVFRHHAPHFLGLAERVLIVVFLAWLAMAARWAHGTTGAGR